MSEPFVFDPRCTLCKYPFGAVPLGAPVTLHVRPEGREGFVRCALLLRAEFAGEEREWELQAEGWDGERQRFSLTFPAPETPELCWYAFRLTRADGSVRYLDASGWADQPQHRWQMTVYDAASPTPGWFGEGLTYQIFPDRFCRSRLPDMAEMPAGRRLHGNWEDIPDYLPDGDGEYCRDFFGGDLAGIRGKLPYLRELGVETLYLCPIFEASSNHRYNTGDYRRIDPMLGTEEDFRALCQEAHALGIRVILDGVFNHNGRDSRYFNADGRYDTLGAAQSQDSPYYPWFHFHPWPTDYDAWWGIRDLPAVNEDAPSYRDFIFGGEDSVIRHWLRAGADGWRLDVADELPDDFIAGIRQAMDETKPGCLLLGEVWEDGSNKIAYSQRRRYLLGGETHCLMNYPFRTAALCYLRGGDAAEFRESMETLRENYPAPAFLSAMNFLGTHDTPRVLSLLGEGQAPAEKAERAVYRLDPEEERLGKERWKLASALLYAFPGSPMLFYGDEAGLQGLEDPFCRGGYPWGREDGDLLAWFRLLGRVRKRPSLRRGDLTWLHAQGPLLAFRRQAEGETTAAAFNAGDADETLTLPWEGREALDLLTGQRFAAWEGRIALRLPARGAVLLAETER
ncbi:MAG: glycoside hydrolase family 13 protein [Dysosmobacter sp.]|nr:glycoside hydrolase family 13 protein [Dysosmobacter sp.]